MIGMYSNILERHYKKGSRKGRFKISESVSKFWKEKYDTITNNDDCYFYGNKAYKIKPKKNIISKLKNIEPSEDAEEYFMPVYKNTFIRIMSFIPRDSNRLKHRLIIPRWTKTKTGAILYFSDARKLIFDSYASAKRRAFKFEKEHVAHVKKMYEEYYKTHSYE